LKYDILVYGHPSLRRKAEPVGSIDDGIRQLAKDMLATMYDHSGLGLAASQVGRSEAMFVIDVPSAQDINETTGELDNPDLCMPLVLVNPHVVSTEGTQAGQEGCLSFPEIFVEIKRPETVTIAYTDFEGSEQTIETHGLLARAVQHEVDHLQGVLLADRMSPVQKVSMAGRLKRLKKTAANMAAA